MYIIPCALLCSAPYEVGTESRSYVLCTYEARSLQGSLLRAFLPNPALQGREAKHFPTSVRSTCFARTSPALQEGAAKQGTGEVLRTEVGRYLFFTLYPTSLLYFFAYPKKVRSFYFTCLPFCPPPYFGGSRCLLRRHALRACKALT